MSEAPPDLIAYLADMICADLDDADLYPDHSLHEGVVLALEWIANMGMFLTPDDPRRPIDTRPPR